MQTTTETNQTNTTQNNTELRPNFRNFANTISDEGSTNDNHFMKKNNATMNQQSSKQTKNPNVMKRPCENDEEILNFFLTQFKCEPCPLKKGVCQDKSTCKGWHHDGERRRNPGNGPNYLYSEEPCPKVKAPNTNRWLNPTNCKDGESCRFSHTLMEQMYHPNIYKTSMCTHFTSSIEQCKWGYFCTHAHGQADIRTSNKKNIAKRNGKQKQQKSQTHTIENPNNNSLGTTKKQNVPKFFQNIAAPIKTTIDENEAICFPNRQINGSQTFGNSSPSRSHHTSSYHTPSYHTPSYHASNVKQSPLSTNHSTITQTSKPLHLSLQASSAYYPPQIPSHAKTPNNMNYDRAYFTAPHTFPNRANNENQQEFSWDNASNSQQISSTFISSNSGNYSPPLLDQFDMCHAYSPNDYDHDNLNVNDMNELNNLHNGNSVNHNNKMNTINDMDNINNNNISSSHMTQPFDPPTSTLQHSDNNIWTTNTNDVINQDISNHSATNNVEYYLFGNNALMSPTSPPAVDLLAVKQNNEFVDELAIELNTTKKKLESEKEKTKVLQSSQGATTLFDKMTTCPHCNVQQKTFLSHVLIPCGHLTCGECAPQKGKPCPMCNVITNRNPQRLNI